MHRSVAPPPVRAAPPIAAATMLGSLAVILARAELCYRHGASPADAINQALCEHVPALTVETACGVVWGLMLDPTEDELLGPALGLAKD